MHMQEKYAAQTLLAIAALIALAAMSFLEIRKLFATTIQEYASTRLMIAATAL